MVFNIFGRQIVVKKEDGLSERTGALAYYCDESHSIVMDSRLRGKQFQQTLLHEFFHAVFFRIGFAQTRISEDAHEMLVENFATALVENKKAIKSIIK